MGQFDWLLSTIDNPNNWGRWKPGAAAANEGGVDLTLPHGTPIYALATGKVVGAGTFTHADGSPGYGVLTEQTDVPGLGKANVYYQHIDLVSTFKSCQNGSCGNQTVQKGQLIGYTRPDMYGLEVGINPTWRGVWAGNTAPGAWVTDPRPYLKALAQQTTPTAQPPGTKTGPGTPAAPVTPTSTPGSTIQETPGCTKPSNPLDVGGGISYAFCQARNTLASFGEHIAVFIFGMSLIGIGVYLLGHKQINSFVVGTYKTGTKLGEALATDGASASAQAAKSAKTAKAAPKAQRTPPPPPARRTHSGEPDVSKIPVHRESKKELAEFDKGLAPGDARIGKGP